MPYQPHGGHPSVPEAPRSLPIGDRPQVTTAAMERFACVAERCEDTCCRDWAVSIDRPSLDRLKAVMARTPQGRDKLVRLVVLGSPSAQVNALGHVQLDDHGTCQLLEPNNRCSVHAGFGEEALPTTCAIFPRTAVALPDQIEVGGSLGCPEVARLMLLTDEALTLRPAEKPMLTRDYVGKTVSGDGSDAYARYFPGVREVLLRCFRREVALGTRLVLAADFAQRAGSLLYAGTAEMEGARRPFAERTLAAEMAETESPALVASLDGDLEALVAPGDATASLIATWLAERKRLPHSARFGALIDQVFASIHAEALGRTPGPGDVLRPADLWRVYARRRDALQARVGARSDRIFGNYCQHFVLRTPYTDAATLLEYLTKLGVHLAAVRFLTVTHPDLEAALADQPSYQSLHQIFDRVAIHAIQTFTKAIGHHVEYTEMLLRPPAGSAGFSFGRLVMLAKFV